MAERLDELNSALREDLTDPLRIGIGIHVGTVILGEMGYRRTVHLTAIGDAVNTASRLETLTKEYGAQLVVSQPVGELAGLDLSTYRRERVALRGRQGELALHVIEDARALPQ